LLRAGLKISCALSLRAHALNCIHHIRLLCQECVSQIRRPLDIARHALYYVWKLYQSLDAWVPRLFCHRVRQPFAFQILVPIHPLLQLDDLEWISRSSQRLCQKWIRIKGDRRDQRIQFTTRKLRRLLRGRHNLGLSLLCQHD
jgi:hypothetical protein